MEDAERPQLDRMQQYTLLRHRTGIILPGKALSDDYDGLLPEGTPPTPPIAFGSKQFFDELAVPSALRKVITRAMQQPPTRDELRNLGIYSSAELKAAGL